LGVARGRRVASGENAERRRKITSEDERLTTDLPPELSFLASLVDAQPAPVREAFRYCLALAMVEAGKARLVGQEPGKPAPP
jgi:hypothetical protein